MAWAYIKERITVFDVDSDTTVLHPGDNCSYHGIYVCLGCGREIALPVGHQAPPQNHHQHPAGTAIRWKLSVFADSRADVERK